MLSNTADNLLSAIGLSQKNNKSSDQQFQINFTVFGLFCGQIKLSHDRVFCEQTKHFIAEGQRMCAKK